jgi:hypothetical protein
MSDRIVSALVGGPMEDPEANAAGLLSRRQMAILTGVSEEELSAEFQRQRADRPEGELFGFRMPKAWVRQGKERAALARTDDMGHAMQILQVVDDPAARWADSAGAIWSVAGRDPRGVPLMSTRGSVTRGPLSNVTVQDVVSSYGPLRSAQGGTR